MEKDYTSLISEYISNKSYKKLRELYDNMNEPDIAEAISELSDETMLIAFRFIPKDQAAEVFSYLDEDGQANIVKRISDYELSDIVDDLFLDDVVDMVGELPADIVERVLRVTDPSKRSMINKFLSYPDNCAGSIMTSEYIRLSRDMKVSDAIDYIRKNADETESIYTLYVTDPLQRLLGMISIQDLLTNKNNALVGDLMETTFAHVTTSDDVEEVARQVRRYDLVSIPVTDKDGKLVGIITIDDIVDVITEEAEEDFEKMAAIVPTEKPYTKLTVWDLAKSRVVWLLLFMVTSALSGAIIEGYEAAISTVPILASFIPMLMDTGGNAGSQSSTVIIRSLALDEIDTDDFFKVFMKESSVALIVGAVLALGNFVRIMIQYPGNTLVALTVSICVWLIILMSKIIGGLLPILAKKLKMDPAIMAAPLITTAVDMLSLVIYFNIAKVLLKGMII